MADISKILVFSSKILLIQLQWFLSAEMLSGRWARKNKKCVKKILVFMLLVIERSLSKLHRSKASVLLCLAGTKDARSSSKLTSLKWFKFQVLLRSRFKSFLVRSKLVTVEKLSPKRKSQPLHRFKNTKPFISIIWLFTCQMYFHARYRTTFCWCYSKPHKQGHGYHSNWN